MLKVEGNDMKRAWKVWILILVVMLSGTAFAEAMTLDDDMGVQVILPDSPAAPVEQDLSHLALGQTYTLPGFAKVKPMSFSYVDSLAQYAEGADLTLKQWISFREEDGVDVRLGDMSDQTRATMHNYVLLIGSEIGLDPKEWSDVGLSSYLNWDSGWSNRGNTTPFLPDCSWQESGLSSDFACIEFQIVNMQGQELDLTKDAEVIVDYDEAQYKGWIRKVNENVGQVYRYCVNEAVPHYAYAAIAPNDATPIATGESATYVVGATLPNIAIEDEAAPLSITLILDGEELTYHIR